MDLCHRKMRARVDAFIDNVASSNVAFFYLETISVYTKLSLSDITSYVFQLVEWDELIIKYEIRCLEYDCNSKIIYDYYDQIPFEEQVEDFRGHSILVEKDLIVPRFEVSENRNCDEESFEKKPLMFFR